jgi:SAM-dependent methyltransferase
MAAILDLMSDQNDRERLRATFTGDAELYHRARPGYPAAIFADLAELTGAGPGCRVLEIGCGTGQATRPLAEMGCEITAVELGAEMAAVARRELARFPGVRVVNATFEEWPLPAEPYDLVIAATSFHWIDPAVRLVKAAEALRPGGSLAIVGTEHVAGGTEPFFVDAQRCYERFDPATPPGLRLTPAAGIPVNTAELEAPGLFGPVARRRHEWEITYPTGDYIAVLSTYSNHRDLPADALSGLLGCIARLIDTRYGGRITKNHLIELRVTKRR